MLFFSHVKKNWTIEIANKSLSSHSPHSGKNGAMLPIKCKSEFLQVIILHIFIMLRLITTYDEMEQQ